MPFVRYNLVIVTAIMTPAMVSCFWLLVHTLAPVVMAQSNSSNVLSFNNFTASASSASFQYVTNSSLPANVTAPCAAALMSQIGCDPWIGNWYGALQEHTLQHASFAVDADDT